MGVVCEAIHLDLGKKVAVKLIDKSMKESELIVARFRREARAAGQIQSEHIVDVFDVGADARVGLYMVMEHLTGEDLQTRLERDKRLDVKTGVMIGHQIARGLAKAHAAGVIHRDLKPANVFLTSRDNGQLLVKILDFGVSKLLAEEPGSARITGSGAPIGTPLYMAPEQAEGKDDIDGRADIWSLGAVLYETFAGVTPFADRGSYHGTIVGILTSRPKLLHDAAPWVPADVANVVDAMLVHDREARLRDADTVTRRLLEAYPAVMPDGTGRHTAVIVAQATAAVDATGDTEFFTSASMPAFRKSSPSHPSPSRPSMPEDSKRTVPDASSGTGPSSAGTTRAATPVGAALEGSDSLTPGSGTTASSPGAKGGPKTAPLPWGAAPSSSAGGVSMPATPPVIEPLPPSEVAPDTTRDDTLAVRAERRRRVTYVLAAAAVVAVALGGYLAGRRAAPSTAAPSASPAPPSASLVPQSVSAAPLSAPPPASVSSPPAEQALAGTTTAPAAPDPAVPSVSASALPSAPPARPHTHRKPKVRTTAAASGEAPSAEPTPGAPAPEAPAPPAPEPPPEDSP